MEGVLNVASHRVAAVPLLMEGVLSQHRVVWQCVAQWTARFEVVMLLQVSPRVGAHVAPTVRTFAMWSVLRWTERRVNHAAVVAVARRFSNLRTVSLRGCRSVPDAAAALACARKLEAVDVSDCRVTIGGCGCLAEGAPGIVTLNAADSNLCDGGLRVLAGALALERVELGGCARVGDAGVFALAEHGARLAYVDLGWRLPLVTARAAAALAAACPGLAFVDLDRPARDAACVVAFERRCPRLPRWVLANLAFSLDRRDFEALCGRYGLPPTCWTRRYPEPRSALDPVRYSSLV